MSAQRVVSRHELLQDCTALVAWLQSALQVPPPEALAVEFQLARRSSVLVPLFAGADGEPHVLFTERSATLRHHRGEISFPGGKPDPADRSLWATAQREAYEEIGLDPVTAHLVGTLHPVFTFVTNYLITPHVALVTGPVAQIAPAINAAEVASVLDIPLHFLDDPANHYTETWIRLGRRITIFFYEFAGHRIWGATANMVADLLARLPPA